MWKQKDVLYLAGILIYCVNTFIAECLDMDVDNILHRVMNITAYLFFVLAILKQEYNLKKIIIYFCITVLTIISAVKYGNWTILGTVLLIMAAVDCDLNVIVKRLYKFNIVMLSMSIFYAFMAYLLSGRDIMSHFSTEYSTEAYFRFGFPHSNMFGLCILNIIAMWLWINYRKINKKTVCKLMALNFILLLLSGSKTVFMLSNLLVVLCYVFNDDVKGKNELALLASAIVPILVGIIYKLLLDFQSLDSISLVLDTLFTGRIRLGAFALHTYGTSFWGQNIDFEQRLVWDDVYRLNWLPTFDCLYSWCLVSMGWVWLVLISICFFYLAHKKNNKINIFIIVWALYGVTEIHGFSVSSFFPLLLITQIGKSNIEYDIIQPDTLKSFKTFC